MTTEVTEEQKDHLEDLIQSGEKLEAIRYAQQTFGLDAEQAITMVEKLEQQIEGNTEAELEESIKDLNSSTAKLPKILGGIFSSIGLLLLVLAVWFGNKSYSFLEKAVPVPGIVKDFTETKEYNKEERREYTLFWPIVQYHYEGRDYTWKSNVGSSSPSYDIGNQIPLLIDPAKPGDPEEDSFFSNWFLPLLLGAVGMVFAGVGIIVLRSFRNP
ncbi:MAG TPA: DUF3592 domain-containing protein [Cyclobacteriaceae bacterium]|nr:DUF3592 domain-containing protein [Cyclobacteriaceae bacterium]